MGPQLNKERIEKELKYNEKLYFLCCYLSNQRVEVNKQMGIAKLLNQSEG